MATYHLTAKIGKKGMGEAHAAYISREGKYSEGKRYEDLEAKESGNMPAWAEHNSANFWQAADEKERANGSVYREIEIALPREFTPAQRLELVQEFIKNEIADKHAYQFAIHIPKAALEKGEQPHAHIMYSERIRDRIERDPDQYFKRYNAKNPEKGGAKKFRRGDGMEEVKEELVSLRERWATLQNKHLEQNGHNDRVDHRSLKDRGIDREPEIHLGGLGVRKTNQSDIKALLTLRAANTEHEQAKAEVVNLLDYKKRLTATPEQQEEIREAAVLEMAKYKQERAEQKAKDEREETNLKANAFMARIAKYNELNVEANRVREEFLKREEKAKQDAKEAALKIETNRTPEEKVELAKQFINDFENKALKEWRKVESENLKEEADILRKEIKELLSSESKKPLIFGKKEWEQESYRIHSEVLKKNREIYQIEYKAKDVQNRTPDYSIYSQAVDQLGREYPERYHAFFDAKEKREKEIEQRKQEMRQELERKRERNRDRDQEQDYGR